MVPEKETVELDEESVTPSPEADEVVDPATTEEGEEKVEVEVEEVEEKPVVAKEEKDLGPKGREEVIIARKKRQIAEKEIEYLKGQLEAYKNINQSPQSKPQQSTQLQEPQIEKFESYDDYVKAVRLFDRNLAKQEAIEEFKQQQFIQQERETTSKFQESIKKIKQEIPDLDDAFNSFKNYPATPASISMANIIVSKGEAGVRMAHYLGTNPEEAERLIFMDPLQAVYELREIENKVNSRIKSKPLVKKISNAPEPIKTVNTRGSVFVDEDKQSDSEWIRDRNKKASN